MPFHGVDAAPVLRELTAPPDALLRLAGTFPDEFPVLLDSAIHGPGHDWSVLGAFPEAMLWRDLQGLKSQGYAPVDGGFLDNLQHWWQTTRCRRESTSPAAKLPFRGGWLVFLGYETAAEVEPTIDFPRRDMPGGLVAAALRVACAVLRHASGRLVAVAEPGREPLLDRLEARLTAVSGERIVVRSAGHPAHLQEDEPAQFLSAVATAKRHIAAGDIYQANLSRAWRAPWGNAAGEEALYRALREANPAPFAAWARLPGLRILSSSPERLVRVRGARVETRPIAGTRARRGESTAAGELAELLANPKERAEHVMLIDLERNDLGRVCRGGSVQVDEFMVTESYRHVHHIVSNVSGELLPDTNPVSVLRALFPGGTITGCPKYRCMQLIGVLEGVARGAYTGSLGYINCDGDMDFSILIRTLTLGDGWLQFRAGAGIVADSDGERELAETRAKAQGLLRAVQVASTP